MRRRAIQIHVYFTLFIPVSEGIKNTKTDQETRVIVEKKAALFMGHRVVKPEHEIVTATSVSLATKLRPLIIYLLTHADLKIIIIIINIVYKYQARNVYIM